MEVFRKVPQVMWIRVGALGDLLISTAALEKTFERFPDSQIWVLGDRFWLELLQPAKWPRLNGIIVRKKSNRGQLYVPAENGDWQREGETKSLHYFYRRSNATVNLRIESYRFAWAPFFWRVPIRIGSSPWPMKWLYTHWSPWLGKEPPIHERDWYVMVAAAPRRTLVPFGGVSENRRSLLGGFGRPEGRLPSLKEPNRSTVTSLTSGHSKLLPVEFGKYWLINPTASRVEKAWPAAKFRELCFELKSKLEVQGLQLVVVGAPNETEWLMSVAGHDFHVVQPPTLGELIDVVAGSRLLVTNTSSVQFIAAGTGTPTITLMGRSQPIRWGPVGPQDKVVQGRLPEPPIADIFLEEQQAYESISVGEVVRACGLG